MKDALARLPGSLYPFWLSGTMREESLLFVRPATGGVAEATLMFTPTALPRLQNCMGTESYEPGRDYAWEAGSRRITLPEGSRIAVMSEAALYPPRGSQKHGTCRDREADLLFAETTEFHRVQVAASYPHARDGWRRAWAPAKTAPLPRLAGRLEAGLPVRVVLLGDSISVGMNASGLYGAPPEMPGYGPLVARGLKEVFGAEISFTNLSVGGRDAQWGVEQMEAVGRLRPDVLLIAFGMNDASACKPAERFAEEIGRQIQSLRAACAEAECVLVAGMTGHPQWTGTQMAFYPQYRERLLAMQAPGVAVADVYSVWEALVRRKKYVDLTGNGLNHPNDFGHRVYAMGVLSALLGRGGGSA